MIRDYREQDRRINQAVKVTAPSINKDQVFKHFTSSSEGSASSYLHDTQSLCLLHLAQNRSEDLVQLFPELGSCPGDQSGHQPAHEGSREL